MNKKIIISVMILFVLVLSVYASSPAAAKAKPSIFRVQEFACMKTPGEMTMFGGVVLNVKNEVHQNVLFVDGKEWGIDTVTISDYAFFDGTAGFLTASDFSTITVNGKNGNWQGLDSWDTPIPYDFTNPAGYGLLRGTGSFKGKVMYRESYMTATRPPDWDTHCKEGTTAFDYSEFDATIYDKND
jgi:hypothetical protein